MNIFKIEIENYRLLKNFSIDLEEGLSLVIGKNNTGKTSFLTVLDKFLNNTDKNKFQYHDFNIDLKKEIEDLVKGDFIEEDIYKAKGIKMKIFIQYTEVCDLENLSRIMMDLDPENFCVVLGFEYTLSYNKYLKLLSDYKVFETRQIQKKVKTISEYKEKTFADFLLSNHSNYFNLNVKSIAVDKNTHKVDEKNCIDLNKEKGLINNIINFKYISARRSVANKDADKTLSLQTSIIYDKIEKDPEQNSAIDEFNDSLSDADDKLTSIYNTKLFNKTIENIKRFGGIKEDETNIAIISSLQQRDLLKGNTTVVYEHDANNKLPEHYNGLGYMNLICMIFEIEIKLREFKRDKDNKPADINLLFIEEPEAHTHPQMQYVFIKNIKKLLGNEIVSDGISRNLQCVISTHSSHIVANSDFDDIKYLKKVCNSSVIVKNLKDLKKEYEENNEIQNYRFLKQYLTLHRAELFFADKAIFVEGETEQILLPSMMRKIDLEYEVDPLLSQNISIISIGAHSKIFEKFIDFIGLTKALIITDLDSYYEMPKMEKDGTTPDLYKNGNQKMEHVKCEASNISAKYTKNSSLHFFHQDMTPDETSISYYNSLKQDWKILRKKNGKWVSNRKSNLFVCYQTKENNYIARSFEDAFFNTNKKFIVSNRYDFPSLTEKWLNKYCNDDIGALELAEKGVDGKPSFAIEILLNSSKENSLTSKAECKDDKIVDWEIPAYIKEIGRASV